MNTFWKNEWKSLGLITAAFIVCFYLPVEYLQDSKRLTDSFWEALYLVRWYAQEHVLLCLIPAFIIAGAISVFISQAAVMKYLGVNADKSSTMRYCFPVQPHRLKKSRKYCKPFNNIIRETTC